MPGSALLGDPPISDDDELIYNYFGGANSSSWTFLKEARTQSAPQHTQSFSIIIGNSFAILFTLIITTARLWVRKYHLRAFGVDDFLIIPAAMGCVTFLSLQIVEAVVGGLGKRRLSWTYQEYAWSDQVCCIVSSGRGLNVVNLNAAFKDYGAGFFPCSVQCQNFYHARKSKDNGDHFKEMADCSLGLPLIPCLRHAHSGFAPDLRVLASCNLL